MSDVATEILAATLHREEMRKALLGWFETAKRRSGNGDPSVYNKEDFSRLTASIVAASKADAMIESHMRKVMVQDPLLAAALWMEIRKLIEAVYWIGGLSEISDSEEHLVEWNGKRKLGMGRGKQKIDEAAKWRIPALEYARLLRKKRPSISQAEIAEKIIAKEWGDDIVIPAFEQVKRTVAKFERDGTLTRGLKRSHVS
jgi:hypothetical protein